MSRSRSFCFTLNNYTAEQYEAVILLESKYLIVGKETGESGTPHLQGFISFANAKTLSAVAKLLFKAHVECCKGTPVQASEYCKKDGKFFEKGVLPMSQVEKGQSEKDRWIDVIKLSEAADWDGLRDRYPDVYANKLKNCEYLRKKRKLAVDIIDGEMEHEWIVGKTGCGKSRSARERFPLAFIKDPNSKWWDGYDGEEVVIIDDFDKFQVSQGGDMKRWIDRYPFQAQFKGGYELIRPRVVIVTSQYHPNEIWDDVKTVDALLRRVKLVNMSSPDIPDMFVSTFNK